MTERLRLWAAASTGAVVLVLVFLAGYNRGASDIMDVIEVTVEERVEASGARLRAVSCSKCGAEAMHAYSAAVSWYERRIEDISWAYKECLSGL